MPRRVLSRALPSAACLLALAAGAAAAQVPLTPRGLAMGGALVANARGHESIFYNPANLGLSGNPFWSVAFPQLSVGVDLLGPALSDLPDFIDYDSRTPAERDVLLATVPERGATVGYDLRAPLVAVQVGNLGFGLAVGSLGEHTVGRDLIELLFDGYQEGRFDYRVGDTRGERITYWDLSAGYGASAGPLSLGITGHYYRGRSLVQTRAFEPTFDLFGRDIEVEYVGVTSPGGNGYGVDLGAALEPVPGLTVGVAVANVVSDMEWDDQLVGRSITLTSQDFDSGEFMPIEDRYDQSARDIGASPTGRFAQTAVGLFQDVQFPSSLRVGASWSAGVAQVAGSYEERLGGSRLVGRWERTLGGGVQVGFGWVALRAGATTDLDGGGLLGGGLRLGVLNLGIARYQKSSAVGEADRDGVVGSFSVNVRTRPR